MSKRNGFILTVIVVLIGTISIATGMRWYYQTQAAATVSRPLPPVRPGSRLRLSAVDWAQARRHTIVLVISETCHACSESAQWYLEFANAVRSASDTRLVVVSGQEEGSIKRWINLVNMEPHQLVIERDPLHQGFVIYPTLLFITPDGIVSHMWAGKLTSDEEEEVKGLIRNAAIASVKAASPDAHFAKEINEAELLQLRRTEEPILLDPRDRRRFQQRHYPGAINIPRDEIESRLLKEVSTEKMVVIDCTDWRIEICRVVGWNMKDQLGFQRTYVLAAR